WGERGRADGNGATCPLRQRASHPGHSPSRRPESLRLTGARAALPRVDALLIMTPEFSLPAEATWHDPHHLYPVQEEAPLPRGLRGPGGALPRLRPSLSPRGRGRGAGRGEGPAQARRQVPQAGGAAPGGRGLGAVARRRGCGRLLLVAGRAALEGV